MFFFDRNDFLTQKFIYVYFSLCVRENLLLFIFLFIGGGGGVYSIKCYMLKVKVQ